jgi:PelA/Pel-15E family pectate lyase
MMNVVTLLQEAAAGATPFAFVDEARRVQAKAAVAKALDCVLRTQVKQDGKLTAWCAQHDEKTLAPAPARNFEPVSLSGSESVGLVRFLMSVEKPTPEIIAAVEGAVAWFQQVQIRGLRTEAITGADGKRDRRAVKDPAAPPVWARFYELGTNKPIYLGRDKVVRYDFNEIEQERRAGYSYLSDWPANLLAKDYPRWRAKHKLP